MPYSYMVQHKKLASSFRFAIEGLVHALKYNQNLRIHFAAGFIVVIASIIFRVNAFEMGILGVMILLVICAEMINTAIEEMVDLISREHHEQAKVAKDVAAGMVFLTAAGSVIVGILVFTPHIIRSFSP